MDMTVAATEPAPKRPRGRPRKTVEDRDDGNRRQALVAGAAKLFRRKGFDATSTRDIAAAVGMQSGSPFYHFKSKGALLYAVMEEGMRSAIERQAAEAERGAAKKTGQDDPRATSGGADPKPLRCAARARAATSFR
jgi:AcrR family transcriptional regulator